MYIPVETPIYSAPCPEDAIYGILVRDSPASNRFMCRLARGFPDASSWTSSASAARAWPMDHPTNALSNSLLFPPAARRRRSFL